MQKIIMPMWNLNLSQIENNKFSHINLNAIDLAGKDWGKESAFAPCDVKVVRIFAYSGMGNAVIFQSVNKVIFADGTENYATFMFMHDNNISDLKVGKTFKQFAKIYDEGDYGFATGNHIHLEVCKGKYVGHAPNGWSLKNNLHSTKAYHIMDKHVIYGTLGNKYKKTEQKETITMLNPTQRLASNGTFIPKGDRAIYASIPKKATKWTQLIGKGKRYDYNGYYLYATYRGVDAKGNKVHFVRVLDYQTGKAIGFAPVYASDTVEEEVRKVKAYPKL